MIEVILFEDLIIETRNIDLRSVPTALIVCSNHLIPENDCENYINIMLDFDLKHVCLCGWAAERQEDLIDEILERKNCVTVPTTSHANEPPDEIVEFVLNGILVGEKDRRYVIVSHDGCACGIELERKIMENGIG